MAKILIISEDLWYPPDAGDSLRQFCILRNLHHEHDFVWCCRYRRKRTQDEIINGGNFARSESIYIPRPSISTKVYKSVQCLATGRPIRQAAHIFRQVWKNIRRLTVAEKFDIIQIEHTKMAEYVNAIDPASSALRILTIQNLAHVFYKRMADSKKRLQKLYYNIESKKYLQFEKKLLNKFNAFITVSDENIKWLNAMGVRGRIHLARNGIPVENIPFLDQSKDSNIMFIGGMDYPPNIDAVLFFAKHVLPLVRRKKSDIHFYIVGRDPHDKVKSLAKDPNITVTGTVSDITPYYKHAALIVVPIRIASGTRLKIVEAMAYGRIVISSTIGAEGLLYKDGENLVIADDSNIMANAIIKVLEDNNFRNQIVLNAKQHVDSYYNCNQISLELRDFYHELHSKTTH